MNVPSSGSGDEELNSTINTTPLVDVMLVMLIIFLITVPVVVQVVPVDLPVASNIPTQTKPENIVITVDKDGEIYWGQGHIADPKTLLDRLKDAAVLKPQPEVHIRGDRQARYEHVGLVMLSCQKAGIRKVGFITEPDSPGQ